MKGEATQQDGTMTAGVMKDTGQELIAELGGVEVFRYVYRPDMPQLEAPRPYFHPIRTLDGEVVTDYRPDDHVWHKGISMTVSDLSGENFWGGGSYRKPPGEYVQLPNNGSMRHLEFDAPRAAHRKVERPSVERLAWHTEAGEHWTDEVREFGVTDVGEDSWALDFTTSLTNVRGEPLEFGSPTTNGRELAGYSGFFWRGPSSFTGGAVYASDGRTGQKLMGQTSPWLAFAGPTGTMLFLADAATTWFVRSTPFAAVNPSLAFFDVVTLPPGETLRLSYRVVIGTGTWDRERIESYVAKHPWLEA